ncbi:MAG: patatin family protein [Lachnospiraceae bacterium]|nr:patatin family protein [Lachnospiraceae bacterium]
MIKAGLVLEGGAIRGIFTSGVLDFLMEQELYFPYVIGVSAGACNGIDYVSRQIGRTKNCMIPTDRKNNYLSVKKALKTRSLFDMDLIFDKYPREIFPFDFEAYRRSEIRCELAVTNCITGKAEYMDDREDEARLLSICRASCSMPIVTKMVEVDGIPYMDGGLADSIPVVRMLKQGYKKCVVILTRNAGYRKKLSAKAAAIYRTAYKDYPELVKAVCRRPLVYNHTMDLIERLEEKGHLFVIRPERPVVSRTEQRPEVLEAFYRHGYECMKERYEELLRYLK